MRTYRRYHLKLKRATNVADVLFTITLQDVVIDWWYIVDSRKEWYIVHDTMATIRQGHTNRVGVEWYADEYRDV